MKTRQSSIELLRILAMLVIVAGHFLGQSGLLALHCDSFAAQLFGNGARWACNLFLIVGCWFLADAEFDWRRAARLYLTVLTYTIPLTTIVLACGAHPSMKDVMRGFLPFTGRALWFASAYISLMILTPWLKRVFDLPLKSLGMLVGVLTVLISFVCTLPDEQMCYTIDCCWFVYVYLAVGLAKRVIDKGATAAVWNRRWMRGACLIGGLAIYAGPDLLRWKFDGFIGGWKRICCVSEWQSSPEWGLCAVAIVLGVYAVGAVAEIFRRKWIEPEICSCMARIVRAG